MVRVVHGEGWWSWLVSRTSARLIDWAGLITRAFLDHYKLVVGW